MLQLSAKDSITLGKLFDPEAAPAPSINISNSLPDDPHYSDQELQSLKEIERRAIAAAESSSPNEAFTLLSELIASHPHYASAYNNRAQLRRMLSHSTEDVLADLDLAIGHASPKIAMDPVSSAQARVLKNAYTQRGAVLDTTGKEKEAHSDMEMAARYGSDVARQWLVAKNPYARLCGQMVSEIMKKEIGMQ
ncbi:hypothetical protein EX30DRAFT_339761 [Ascodesmis nigricans]|uniref:Tetratricopeptide repeat protein 36 n=1 Tax=Ascodesmis nigricans TaxID=341454 RepID=A0A4S2N075_9PEZI|nr:hypothetical protein EX30DRAFT_339761 [Ascodesmis nigricans]